jgi:hypothetical protein
MEADFSAAQSVQGHSLKTPGKMQTQHQKPKTLPLMNADKHGFQKTLSG